jgi:hypothetical protein
MVPCPTTCLGTLHFWYKRNVQVENHSAKSRLVKLSPNDKFEQAICDNPSSCASKLRKANIRWSLHQRVSQLLDFTVTVNGTLMGNKSYCTRPNTGRVHSVSGTSGVESDRNAVSINSMRYSSSASDESLSHQPWNLAAAGFMETKSHILNKAGVWYGSSKPGLRRLGANVSTKVLHV